MDEAEFIESPESEDDLEDTPEFFRKNHLENDVDMHLKSSRQKHSKLDALLAEHRREDGKHERLRQLRDRLMSELASNDENTYKEDNEDLATEHADHIGKLKIKSIKLRSVHPGLTCFSASNFGCLFSESTDPLRHFLKMDCGIDQIGSNFSFDALNVLMYSTSTFIDRISSSPHFDSFMQWLLDMLSIHHCAATATNIETMMMSILNHLHTMKTQACWKISAMGLLRILVNLGASPQELTKFQKTFTQEEIRNVLVKVNGESVKQNQKETVNSDRFLAVLRVLTVALEGRCVVAQEDLNLIFYMLAKVALDKYIGRNLASNFNQCFSAIINRYNDSDWPTMVPELCRQLSHVTNHHHNQAYLAGLLLAKPRDSYLQMRLSYTFLYKQLMSEKHQLEDSQFQDMKLTEIAELGIPVEKGQLSTLAVRLHDMLNKDRYKAFSILKLLDMAVGDIFYRTYEQRKELEYLLNQVKILERTIKDRVCQLDLTKMKDVMRDMTVKWSLILQNQRMNKASLFPCATATTHQWVEPEILKDKKEQTVTDKGENNLTDIAQQIEAS